MTAPTGCPAMSDALGETSFIYTRAGQPSLEVGPWPEILVAKNYSQGLRTRLSTLDPNTYAPTWQQTNSYDAAWRLQSLTSPAGTFGYGYNVGQGVSPASLVRPHPA